MPEQSVIRGVLTFVSDYVLILIPAAILLSYLYTYFAQGLWHVPGPFLRSISVIPRIASVYKGFSHEVDIALHQQYGKIVRIAPRKISIADPAEINKIYGIGTKFRKSPFYSLSETHDEEGIIPDPFILTDMKKHTYMKRNAANAYAMHGLIKMEPWIESVTDRFVQMLKGYADQGETVDMARLLKNYTMDAVFALTFGRDFDYMKNGDCLGMHRILEVASDYMAIFGQIPWTHRFLLKQDWVANLVFGSGDGVRPMVELANEQVDRGREKTTDDDEPMTFLQRLLLNQQKDPSTTTDRDIITHAFGNISAGSDTTAIAMQSVILNVMKDPAVYQKLCHEVRTSLTSPVGFNQAKDLPYLGAVIKEAIRIHPSVGMMLARVVPTGGADLCGYSIPAGVEVGINPWVIHRDPVVYPNPDRFYPERWLTSVSGEDHLSLMNRCFFAFGHGAHTCSGRWISMMETTKLIPTLLLNFDIELVDGCYSYKNRWFTMQKGINVKLTRRI